MHAGGGTDPGRISPGGAGSGTGGLVMARSLPSVAGSNPHMWLRPLRRKAGDRVHGSGVRRSVSCSAARIRSGLALGPRLVHEALAFWMQTTGATLLATKRRSLVRVMMAVHDGRNAHGLLYLAAVWRRQARAGTSLDLHMVSTRPAPGLSMSCICLCPARDA